MRERSCRDRVVLLSKCAHPNILGRKRVTEADIRKDFAKSAALLGTDFIDIYLLHRDDPEADVSVPIGVLNAMHKEGKIGIFGVSNWSHKRIQEANDYAARSGLQGFSVSSPHFSLARQQADPWGGGCVSITGEENEEARNWYRENQMSILAYSSLGRGLLSGKLKSTQEDNARKILDPLAYASSFEGRIGCVHLKDMAEVPEETRGADCALDGRKMASVRQGQGVIPLKPIIDLLKKQGYTGRWVLELSMAGMESYGQAVRLAWSDTEKLLGHTNDAEERSGCRLNIVV